MTTAVPPFETFYEAHRSEVLRFLGRRLGHQQAEDAFQETFLRALRAYPRLEHGEYLRAWVLTIASRIVLDDVRKRRPQGELPELAVEDELAAFEQLAPLTDGLPPNQRAAVVLRYGYDLGYDEIGDALGSTEAAARQAASAGVRRIRMQTGAGPSSLVEGTQGANPSGPPPENAKEQQ